MVRPFRFAALPRIYFGPGRFSLLPSLIKKSAGPVLIVTGGKSFEESGRAAMLYEELEKAGIQTFNEYVSGEPSPSIVDRIADQYRDAEIKTVAAIGGGSVIDTGKAVAAMLTIEGPVKDFLEGVGTREHPGTRLPLIAVPTTSGTGSEATKNAVLSDVGSSGFKKSLRHDSFVPDIAIVDPEMTINSPPSLTAASGMDCFTQLVEAYLSEKSTEYTDLLALRAVSILLSSLERAYDSGDDIDARTGMSFASLTSGICLANAGLGTVHGFAASLGALHHIPHGVVCGTLMAPANDAAVRILRKNDPHGTAMRKYAELGKLTTDKGPAGNDYYAGLFVDRLYQISSRLNLTGFGQYGIDAGHADRIVELTDNKDNPVKFSQEDLKAILICCLKKPL